MQHRKLPIYFFPSTTLFVDDSHDFLLNFTLQFDESLSYRLVDSTHETVDIMKEQDSQVKLLARRCLHSNLDADTNSLTTQTINVDFSSIHAEVYNPDRFSEISVMIVDYAMPGMNGLELCEHISSICDSRVKKILLTGQADEKLAINAFNDGLIDRFVTKSDPDVIEAITKGISELQHAYFTEVSDFITNLLTVNSPPCLQDPGFVRVFEEYVSAYDIVEYYLMDASGSFLMLTSDLKVYCLVVKTEEDLQVHFELALDNGASPEILEDLRAGKKIPAFSSELGNDDVWTEWSTYLLPARVLNSKRRYYYAFTQSRLPFDIRANRIRSYDDYLNQAGHDIVSS